MPEVPPVSGTAGIRTCTGLRESVRAVFEPAGALARAIPDFEARIGQLEMALAVASRIEEGGVLLAEAGTGTGKTLAYLIPAILSRQRVLVSTGTKNLQEQIYFKDLPALRDTLGIPFTATYMKGRANYLCLHRLDELTAKASEDGRFSQTTGDAVANVFLPIIRDWATTTETGDRAELIDLPEDMTVWNDVSATAEACLGTECPRYDDCFVTRMRQRAAASDVVIVNHHLLCADAAVRQNAFGEVIPACANAIVDEAHQLEDVATQYFGYSVSNYRLEELAHDIERLPDAGWRLANAIGGLRDAAKGFFTELAFAHRNVSRVRGEDRVRASASSLAAASEAAATLTGALDLMEQALSAVRQGSPDAAASDGKASDVDGDLDRDEAVTTLARRVGEVRDDIRLLLRAGDSDYVYFVEFRGRGIFLRASPVDVSAVIRELLLERMRVTVLTSATLTVEGTFDYIRQRLGIRTAEEIRLPSEFDFERQALMYLPARMPDPRSPGFAVAAGREVVEILKRTEGRAFVLFTSYATMRDVLAIAEMALDYPIFSQGSAPRTQLLKTFRETPHAVLFATSSFWQGVDVVGDALSCVIIDKLPFASPAEPVTAARIEAIRERGGDPFGDYQVPLAILALQQGLGRLIRHRRDRGILAVLDPRLRTKGYGRRFIASMPPAPLVHDLAAVGAFFRAKPAE
ncbi:MAG TPA: ATP-dependent DNA helicase [Vicinamibacterales bacterium]|nr:ATP-dependent DNA helicase [Vicinamibacterales bacterium]